MQPETLSGATTAVRRSSAVLTEWAVLFGEPLDSLSLAERLRHDAFIREQNREDFLAAHLLLRLVVGTHHGQAPTQVQIIQNCSECGGAHGRPQLAASPLVHLSLSHTRGWVGAAAADVPCGIDVEYAATAEPIRRAVTAGEGDELAALALSDRPRAFTRLWVRKEAIVKTGAIRLDEVAEHDVRGLTAAGCSLIDLSVPAGDVLAALALRL